MPSQRESLLCHYRYDAMDQLIGSELTTKTELQRFYCKSRLATEVQGTLQRSIFQQDDQLLAQQQRQDGKFDTTLLVTDQQRSVLHTLSENSPRQAIAYPPYGHHRAESGLTSMLGFNGERPDPVTGHYILGNGYRAFNPVLMRFNSPDSLSPFGKGGLNPYAYCSGDPVNFSDPTGNIPIIGRLADLFNDARRAMRPKPKFVIDGQTYVPKSRLTPHKVVKEKYNKILEYNQKIDDKELSIARSYQHELLTLDKHAGLLPQQRDELNYFFGTINDTYKNRPSPGSINYPATANIFDQPTRGNYLKLVEQGYNGQVASLAANEFKSRIASDLVLNQLAASRRQVLNSNFRKIRKS